MSLKCAWKLNEKHEKEDFYVEIWTNSDLEIDIGSCLEVKNNISYFKKDILINLLINKKNNFNENIDYEISSIKNINLSINTIKHICLMKNNLYREYHLNNENTLLLNNININKKINTVNNFFDNNNIDDFFNKYIYYIIKLNDNIYSYGSTFTILKTFNSYKKLYDNNK